MWRHARNRANLSASQPACSELRLTLRQVRLANGHLLAVQCLANALQLEQLSGITRSDAELVPDVGVQYEGFFWLQILDVHFLLPVRVEPEDLHGRAQVVAKLDLGLPRWSPRRRPIDVGYGCLSVVGQAVLQAAADALRGLELPVVVLAQPKVHAPLLAGEHHDALVQGARVDLHWLLVQRVREQHRRALPGGHADVQLVEARAAPDLDVREVHQEGEDPGPVRQQVVVRTVVVVGLVEHALLVGEGLDRLEVLQRHAAYPRGPVLYGLDYGSSRATAIALPDEGVPLRVPPSHPLDKRNLRDVLVKDAVVYGDLAPYQLHVKHYLLVFADLRLRQEVVEVHDPGVRANYPGAILRKSAAENGSEGLVQIPGPPRRRVAGTSGAALQLRLELLARGEGHAESDRNASQLPFDNPVDEHQNEGHCQRSE
eukprot:CAMPEP_0175408616 /NCGR_PEP_ID=MMETSP0095-20121207/40683_1 /TAXON_ID=311494 /ORGANISM="Alexandrium monilatum, Strain CCMP3105" /LENGTH=428 /DNA_ID=CAMNT_0016707537 /DNA_START=47 /DNA_END=1330 /DNA_ORIENTATION=+